MANIIVFIHGIGSNNRVWGKFIKAQNKDSKTKNIEIFIPNKTSIKENTTYYYLHQYESKKTSSFFTIKFWKERIKGISVSGNISTKKHSQTFYHLLKDFSKDFAYINVVAHSMGGIITMQMILNVIKKDDSLKQSIKTCMLYGSPLKGSDDPSFLESILGDEISSDILKELKPSSPTIITLLKDIEDYKVELKNNFDIAFIAGDADSRLVEITEDFINKFGTFKQIIGGHSQIVTPKNKEARSFTSYKDIVIERIESSKTKNINEPKIEVIAEKILKEYIKKRITNFNSESDSLQTLNKQFFVNIFDITINSEKINTENDNLSYFEKLCTEKIPKFLLSYYGMGKSTIAKQLFEYINSKTNNYAIFIDLHLKSLSQYYSINEKLYQYNLTNKIFEEIISVLGIDSLTDININDLFSYFRILLRNGKLTLIFDGLDEVNINTHEINDKISLKHAELDGFINTIYSEDYSIFLTCRKEYSPFYNSYICHKDRKKTYEIELLEWRETQWENYINSIEKTSKKDLSQLRKDILEHKYADLPSRPLFLSMLTELIVFNNNDLSNITTELKTNLAEIYNKYIDYSLEKDVLKKSQEIKYKITNPTQYKKVWKKLLIELAYYEYKNNALFSLNEIVNIAMKIDKNEKYYKKEEIEHAIESSALFSIIHREYNSDKYNFSHKSFLEYLLAHKLASNIFTENITDASCNESWKLYQTNEIHHHFMEEIIRVAFYKNIIEPCPVNGLNHELLYNNAYIEKAFEKLLVQYTNKKEKESKLMLTLHEDYQAVIYYIGKFKIVNLQNYLEDISRNQNDYHSTFFRTVSLSLSSINDDSSYCDKYVLRIIEDLINNDNDKLFYENVNIQKKYHGSNPSKLRKRLEKNLKNFIENNIIVNNLSLIALTYYTAFPPSYSEIIAFNREIKIIKAKAIEHKYKALILICDCIPEIWEKIAVKYIQELSK